MIARTRSGTNQDSVLAGHRGIHQCFWKDFYGPLLKLPILQKKHMNLVSDLRWRGRWGHNFWHSYVMSFEIIAHNRVETGCRTSGGAMGAEWKTVLRIFGFFGIFRISNRKTHRISKTRRSWWYTKKEQEFLDAVVFDACFPRTAPAKKTLSCWGMFPNQVSTVLVSVMNFVHNPML